MSVTRTPAKHFAPLAIGAPEPYRALPVRLERMIHFVPPHNEKIRAKLKEIIAQVDVVLGNLEDAIPADDKEAARAGFIEMAQRARLRPDRACGRASTASTRPWMLDDVIEIVPHAGDKLDVIMLPKVEGPGTSTTSTSCWPSSRPGTQSRSRSSSTPSWRRPKASRTSRPSPPPPRACTA